VRIPKISSVVETMWCRLFLSLFTLLRWFSVEWDDVWSSRSVNQ